MDQIAGQDRPPQTMNASETISAIVWARQLSQKVQSNLKAAQQLFGDLQGLAKYGQSAKDVCEQIKDYEQGQFDKWAGNIQRAMQSNEKTKYQLSG